MPFRAVDELEDLPQVLDPMVVEIAENVARIHQDRVHPHVERANDIGEIVVADIQGLLGRPAGEFDGLPEDGLVP